MSDKEVLELRRRVRELETRVRELEYARDAIQRDSNIALNGYRATMEDDGPTATTGIRGALAPSARRTSDAGEVLPPDRRASWARGKTPFDK